MLKEVTGIEDFSIDSDNPSAKVIAMRIKALRSNITNSSRKSNEWFISGTASGLVSIPFWANTLKLLSEEKSSTPIEQLSPLITAALMGASLGFLIQGYDYLQKRSVDLAEMQGLTSALATYHLNKG